MGTPSGRSGLTTAFSATLEEVTLGPGMSEGRPSRLLCRVHRSASGRARYDFLVAGAPEDPDMAWLFEPSTRRMVLVERSTGKVLQRYSFEPPAGPFLTWNGAGPFTPFPFPHEGVPRREELGTRVLEGFVTRGTLIAFSDGWHERWTAPEMLDAPLLERWRVTSGHERTSQIYGVRLGEPDPDLFAALDAS
jgi:hypothetical protein